MSDTRTLPAKRARIAELQALRTLASKTALAEACFDVETAGAGLREREEALAGRAADVETCFAAERLDLTALGIGRAMLAALTEERKRATNELAECEVVEGESRSRWLLESRLSERAEDLRRKASRHAARKREDAIVTEITNLRLVHARWKQG